MSVYKVEKNHKISPGFFIATDYFTLRNDSHGACSRDQSCVAIQYILSSWDYEERPLTECFGLLTMG